MDTGAGYTAAQGYCCFGCAYGSATADNYGRATGACGIANRYAYRYANRYAYCYANRRSYRYGGNAYMDVQLLLSGLGGC